MIFDVSSTSESATPPFKDNYKIYLGPGDSKVDRLNFRNLSQI